MKLESYLDPLDDDAMQGLHGLSLLLTSEASLREIEALCTLAELFESWDRASIKVPLFSG